MAVVTMDGRTAAVWCTSIATIGSPTAAEILAGTRLETKITPDGLVISPATGNVDVSNLASVANANRAGRITWSIKITFHHDGTIDTAWNLFPYRTNGFLVVRKGVTSTNTFVATDKVSVYACETGEPEDVDPKPDGVWDFTSDFFVTEGGYVSRAVVA
jgi:hypothetical protein